MFFNVYKEMIDLILSPKEKIMLDCLTAIKNHPNKGTVAKVYVSEYFERMKQQEEIIQVQEEQIAMNKKLLSAYDDLFKHQKQAIHVADSMIDDQKQVITKQREELTGLKENTTFLFKRCKDIRAETLSAVEKGELKQLMKDISLAEKNIEAKTIPSKEEEPELDKSKPYEMKSEIGQSGKREWTRRKI